MKNSFTLLFLKNSFTLLFHKISFTLSILKSSFLTSKKFVYILLFLIALLAFLIRIYRVGLVPASPDWDEAALGYNAYSILLTGKDEYGKFLPVVLRSFDDYKPAMYAYLIIPFIKLFGLSVVSVRLPSILFGVVSVVTVYYLIKELFGKEITFAKFKLKTDFIALLTSFLVAISPWHIQFSRVGFEAGVGLSLNLLAMLFFIKGLKSRYFLVSSLCIGALNLYVYQSEKVYTPLLFLLMIIIFRGQFFKVSKKILASAILGAFLVALPMLIFIMTNPNALARAKGVSVFTDTTKLLSSNKDKVERDLKANDYLGLALDNRRIEYVKAFSAGYLSHFEPNWLFYRGDNARHHAPFMGNLYLFTFPFILLGLYVLLFSDTDKKIKTFIILFMLISPIPASITIDVPHAVRTINFIPSFDLLAALGILVFIHFLFQKRYYLSIPLFGIVAVFVFLNIFYYFNQYFIQQNYYDSQYWQYGWKEAVLYTQEKAKNFDHIVVTNQPPLDQSYMFFLYYLKYDPALYQKEGGTKSGGFNQSHIAFGKYEFRQINWDTDKFKKHTLFLGRPGDLPDNIGKTINYLDGSPAIVFSDKYE